MTTHVDIDVELFDVYRSVWCECNPVNAKQSLYRYKV